MGRFATDQLPPRESERWHRLDASGPVLRIGGHRLGDGEFVHLLTSNGKSWIGVVFHDDDDDGGPWFGLELADDPEPVRIPARDEAVCRLSSYQRRSNLPPRRDTRH